MAAGLADIVKDTFEVTRRHGADLGATMGKVLFQNLRTCIGELVCNAYDADASVVRIDYDSTKGVLRHFDDGTGMDREGIDAFYRLGESVKPRNPISPKGRKRIGKFGIATIALRRLARNYVLETAKDGQLFVVEENISDADLDSKVLNVTVQKTNPERHGTTLTLHDLRFKQGDGLLEMDDLRRYLERNMPLGKDFSIVLNDQAIRPPNIPANAIEYLLDFEGDGISIKGSVYYAGKIPKGHNGIFIRSQGVAVGGNNFDLFGNLMKASVAARIHAMIDVEGVNDLVAYNREKFIEDPRVKSIVRYISQVLKEVRQDMDVDLEYEQKRKAREMLDATLTQVGKKMGEMFKQSEYSIIFDEQRAGAIAKIDRGMRELYINPKSKALRLTKLKGQDVRAGLFQALMHAVALGDQPEQSNADSSSPQGSYADLAVRIHSLIGYRDKGFYFKDLLVLAGEAEAPRRMSPHRLYSPADISRVTDWSNLLIKQMIDAQMVTARNDRLLWKEVQRVQERLEGYTPTTVIIDREYPDVEGENTFAVRQARRRTTISQFARLQEQGMFPVYFVNLAGEGGEPFYVVKQDHERNYIVFMGSSWGVDFMRSPELYFDWLEKKKAMGGTGSVGAQDDKGKALEDRVADVGSPGDDDPLLDPDESGDVSSQAAVPSADASPLADASASSSSRDGTPSGTSTRAPSGTLRARIAHTRPLEEIVFITPAEGVTLQPLPGRLGEYIDGWYQEGDHVLPHFSQDVVPLTALASLWVDSNGSDHERGVQHSSAVRGLTGSSQYTSCTSKSGVPIRQARGEAPYFPNDNATAAILELSANRVFKDIYQGSILAGLVSSAPKKGDKSPQRSAAAVQRLPGPAPRPGTPRSSGGVLARVDAIRSGRVDRGNPEWEARQTGRRARSEDGLNADDGAEPEGELSLEVAANIPYYWRHNGTPDWKGLVRIVGVYDLAIPVNVSEKIRESLRRQVDEKVRGLDFYTKRVDETGKRPITDAEYNPRACLRSGDAREAIEQMSNAGFQLYLQAYKAARKAMDQEV